MKKYKKKIFFLFLLISNIYCSSNDCNKEDDQTKYEGQEVEFNGYSRYKMTNEEDKEGCIVFPYNPDRQKTAVKFWNGFQKEILLYKTHFNKKGEKFFHLKEFEKETYSKGELIFLTEKELIDEDK